MIRSTLLGLLWLLPLAAQPTRWQAQYTRIYSDDFETFAPALGPAFTLEGPGSLTTQASDVISGKTSIKASYPGSSSNPPFLETNSSILPLAANHTYTVSFQYKILVAPSDFFYVQFLSFVAASQKTFLQGEVIQGAAGKTGTITLTSTFGELLGLCGVLEPRSSHGGRDFDRQHPNYRCRDGNCAGL